MKKKVKWNWLVYFLPFIVLFQIVLGQYISTTYVPELLLIYLVLYSSANKCKYESKYLLMSIYCLWLVFYGVVSGLENDYFQVNETYRFFTTFLFICVFMSTNTIDDRKMLEIILFICKACVIYNIAEFIYINFVNPFNFDGLIIHKYLETTFMEGSQYMTPSNDWGIPFVRPFGLLGQPQKSGFIFSIGIIIQYMGHHNEKKSFYWYIFLLLGSIITAGKTAILCNILLLWVIYTKIYFKSITQASIILFILIFVASSLNFLFSNVVSSDIVNDFNAIFNYPIINVFFGTGFVPISDLMNHGFVGESFIDRFILSIGIFNGIIFIISSLYILNTKNVIFNNLVLVLFITLGIHYCCYNSQFIIFSFAFIISAMKKHAHDDYFESSYKVVAYNRNIDDYIS